MIALVLWASAYQVQGASPRRVAHASSEDEAERLIRQGIELRRAGLDEQALERFQHAESLATSARARAQVGLAEQALGRWVAADRDLASALRANGDEWIVKNRAVLESAQSAIANHLGKVTILGSPIGATVLVNGEKAGTLPLAHPFVVVAGEVVVAAEAVGFVSITRKIAVPPNGLVRETIDLPTGGALQTTEPTVALIPGSSRSHGSQSNEQLPRSAASLEIRPVEPSAKDLGAAAGTGGGEEKDTSDQENGGYWTWQRSLGAGLAGLGLASLVLGVVEHIHRERNAADFKQAGCGTDNLATGDCTNWYHQVQSAQRWLIVGYVGAAVLGAGGTCLWWLSPTEPAVPKEGAVASAFPGMTVNLQGQF